MKGGREEGRKGERKEEIKEGRERRKEGKKEQRKDIREGSQIGRGSFHIMRTCHGCSNPTVWTFSPLIGRDYLLLKESFLSLALFTFLESDSLS